jgi:predicted ABC-type transport system involved in lysophospholipase L1 biosynthesis ATPase subunit
VFIEQAVVLGFGVIAGVAAGGAVILATHDPDVADRCDTVFRLAHHIPAA